MPCKDITELITVTLDREDRLDSYSFAKRTCGKAIGGEALLLEVLRGRTLNELLDTTAESFLTEFPPKDEIDEFLGLKHLFAIQGALEVLTGREAGGVDAFFAAGEVAFSENETVVKGRISVDLVTEKIKSCGGCTSCGTVKEGKEKNKQRRAEREKAAASV